MESKSYDDRSERGKIKFCNTVSTRSTSRLHPIPLSNCDSEGEGVAGGGAYYSSAPRSVNRLPDMMKILRATGPGAFKALPVENTTDFVILYTYTVWLAYCKAM